MLASSSNATMFASERVPESVRRFEAVSVGEPIESVPAVDGLLPEAVLGFPLFLQAPISESTIPAAATILQRGLLGTRSSRLTRPKLSSTAIRWPITCTLLTGLALTERQLRT